MAGRRWRPPQVKHLRQVALADLWAVKRAHTLLGAEDARDERQAADGAGGDFAYSRRTRLAHHDQVRCRARRLKRDRCCGCDLPPGAFIKNERLFDTAEPGAGDGGWRSRGRRWQDSGGALRRRTFDDLRAYCERDMLALVELRRALTGLPERSAPEHPAG